MLFFISTSCRLHVESMSKTTKKQQQKQHISIVNIEQCCVLNGYFMFSSSRFYLYLMLTSSRLHIKNNAKNMLIS